MVIFSIIIFLLLCVWLSRNEVAYSLADVHISDILSVKWFGVILLLAMVTGIIANSILDGSYPFISSGSFSTLLLSIIFTVVFLSLLRCHSSVVTAFAGGIIAYCILSDRSQLPSAILFAVLSALIAPSAVLMVAYAFNRWFDKTLFNRECHLLLRTLYIKYVAVAGLTIYGILMVFNYTLFADIFFTPTASQWRLSRVTMGFIIVLTCMGMLFTILLASRKDTRNGKMNHNLSFLYGLSVVLFIGNVLVPLAPGMFSVLVSVNQSKELCQLYFDGSKRSVHLFNMITITLLTPLLSFLAVLCLLTVKNILLSASILTLLLMLAFIYQLYTGLYSSSKLMQKTQSVERLHRSEIDAEMNRLDVMAVTSQFNAISAEIDLKQKELINLSLYIKQERDYLEKVCGQLTEISKIQNLEEMREKIHRQGVELRENLRFSKEMDQFYTEVEEMHKNFVSRLLMRCPNLTERERRLAILLRLGLSSKEIAGLMSIETKSIEINRYRLRKKLRLDRNENIVQYLQLL